MSLHQARHLLDALGIQQIQRAAFLLGPAAAAFLAWRRARSVLIWTTLAFFMPLIAPFALIPLCSVWHTLCGGYGVFMDLFRLAACFACPVYLWTRPAAAPKPGSGRDLVLSLCFLAFLIVAFMALALMFFPAQH